VRGRPCSLKGGRGPTSSDGRWPLAGQAAGEKIERLREENAQLRQAVDSLAVIDQAIGVLIAVWQLPPEDGWEVLREVSQHLNVKLYAIADEVASSACPGPNPLAGGSGAGGGGAAAETASFLVGIAPGAGLSGDSREGGAFAGTVSMSWVRGNEAVGRAEFSGGGPACVGVSARRSARAVTASRSPSRAARSSSVRSSRSSMWSMPSLTFRSWPRVDRLRM